MGKEHMRCDYIIEWCLANV